jgi:hypothetical protein
LVYLTVSLSFRSGCRLLTSVYIVRVASTTWSAAKRCKAGAAFALIIQRPRYAGGVLTVPLDQLVRCSTKDMAQHIIRLKHGRDANAKQLVLRAASAVEREVWVAAIESALTPRRTPKLKPLVPTPPRISFDRTPKLTPSHSEDSRPSRSAGPSTTTTTIASINMDDTHRSSRPVTSRTAKTAVAASPVRAPVVTPLPLQSVDAIKRMVDEYDRLALQWSQVAAETRQFNAQIASLRPVCDAC